MINLQINIALLVNAGEFLINIKMTYLNGHCQKLGGFRNLYF